MVVHVKHVYLMTSQRNLTWLTLLNTLCYRQIKKLHINLLSSNISWSDMLYVEMLVFQIETLNFADLCQLSVKYQFGLKLDDALKLADSVWNCFLFSQEKSSIVSGPETMNWSTENTYTFLISDSLLNWLIFQACQFCEFDTVSC